VFLGNGVPTTSDRRSLKSSEVADYRLVYFKKRNHFLYFFLRTLRRHPKMTSSDHYFHPNGFPPKERWLILGGIFC